MISFTNEQRGTENRLTRYEEPSIDESSWSLNGFIFSKQTGEESW
jgi:hypothetical protein